MKLKTLTTLAALALMLAASPASAQGIRVDLESRATVTPARTNAEVRTQAEVRSGAQTEGSAEQRAVRDERRAEIQANVAKRVTSNTARVMNAMANRLEGIIERLESRIAKVEAEGGVTAEATAHVEAAKDHLALAQTEIAAFATVDLSADTLRENFQTVRNLATEVKMHFRETHTSLMNAVRVLKGMSSARVEAEAEAEADTVE
ncbi:MAG: hypothetical protein NUV78_01390 [Candidatus Zambryskibacteria bacterium]|nr:hypothetical protein [Candidatus Zambryskibacteria bacterium]